MVWEKKMQSPGVDGGSWLAVDTPEGISSQKQLWLHGYHGNDYWHNGAWFHVSNLLKSENVGEKKKKKGGLITYLS